MQAFGHKSLAVFLFSYYARVFPKRLYLPKCQRYIPYSDCKVIFVVLSIQATKGHYDGHAISHFNRPKHAGSVAVSTLAFFPVTIKQQFT